jgi:hypothetical protein
MVYSRLTHESSIQIGYVSEAIQWICEDGPPAARSTVHDSCILDWKVRVADGTNSSMKGRSLHFSVRQFDMP